MGATAKTHYDAGLLAWKRATYESCKTDAKSVDCAKANEIREKSEKARNEGKYYEKNSADREQADKDAKAEMDKFKKSLAAAEVDDKKDEEKAAAKKGEVGFACKATADCGADTLCCGEYKKAGATTATTVCNTKTLTKYETLEFKCIAGAKAMLTIAGTAVAAALLMQ